MSTDTYCVLTRVYLTARVQSFSSVGPSRPAAAGHLCRYIHIRTSPQFTIHGSIVNTLMCYVPNIHATGFPTGVTNFCPHVMCFSGSRIAIRISSARSLSEPSS